MSTKKPTRAGRGKGKTGVSLVRSSAAEYLTFVAAGGSSESSIEMRYVDENIWLTQKMMAALYDVSIPAINQHLKRIFGDNELEEASVVKQYLTTAADGKGYQTKHYGLQAIIAVGFKIENERAVQFRKWANQSVNLARHDAGRSVHCQRRCASLRSAHPTGLRSRIVRCGSRLRSHRFCAPTKPTSQSIWLSCG